VDVGHPGETLLGSESDALAERLFGWLLGGAQLMTVDIGRRLGLYEAVQQAGTVNAVELSRSAGIAHRYAREWLEQQAAAGLLQVAGETDDDDKRRFLLPQAHVPVLVDGSHPANLLGAAAVLAGCGLSLPAVAEAFRTGEGVSFQQYGRDLRHGIALLNRPKYLHRIASWIAEMPDVMERLREGGTVLDAGCGAGWSSVAIASAFPKTEVHGVDLDEESVREAREHALAEGVADRVHYSVCDATRIGTSPPRPGVQYDLVCVFKALPDMADPVAALRAFRGVLKPGGVLMVADEKTQDLFTANPGEAERLSYALSVLHRLPATMAESTGTANGGVLREPTVRAWAAEAGFDVVSELPIEHQDWRFYRMEAIAEGL
jgi:2-polyprenyl-3-methyl-5-hydroxy-6-metoxy-1,4-benzoquinol methylase